MMVAEEHFSQVRKMGHKHDLRRRKKKHAKSRLGKVAVTAGHDSPPIAGRLEIVLKCGAAGSLQAVAGVIAAVKDGDGEIVVISSGIGEITKSDIMMAETGSRLIIGYEVKVNPQIEEQLLQAGVEVRLYSVIYRLTDDLQHLCQNFTKRDPEESITGKAPIIALFKSTRKGIILGCQVKSGALVVGDRFRVINAMGEAYSGRIESLHLGDKAVREAKPGQQVGLKIQDFKKAAIGDLVESFKRLPPPGTWQPKPGVSYHPD